MKALIKYLSHFAYSFHKSKIVCRIFENLLVYLSILMYSNNINYPTLILGLIVQRNLFEAF